MFDPSIHRSASGTQDERNRPLVVSRAHSAHIEPCGHVKFLFQSYLMFQFLKDQFSKIYTHVTSRLKSLFGRQQVDDPLMQELERILLEADTGITTTRTLMEKLRAQVRSGHIKQGTDLKIALEHELAALLQSRKYDDAADRIFLMVGVNGTGKTTFASKLAHHYTQQGKKVLLAAADTFRAAATHQLKVWAERSGAECITGPEGSDPAAVVYAACERFISENYDILIIDTAGRLQNKANLMRELEKIRKVVSRHVPDIPVITLLTIDSMLGQNSFDQARLFNEATLVNGIVLTKMDGTGKGGIVFAITNEIKIPIAYVSFGEHMADMARFEPDSYVKELLEG